MVSKKLENKFQGELIKEIKQRLPNAIVLKNDAGYQQGIPDLIVLNEDRWATLEAKKGPDEPFQPNQEYFVDRMNKMSYSAVVHPENKEEVLDELQLQLIPRPKRKTRISKRE